MQSEPREALHALLQMMGSLTPEEKLEALIEPNTYGNTPLELAIRYGYNDIFKSLLNSLSPEYFLPAAKLNALLGVALEYTNEEIISFLKEKKAVIELAPSLKIIKEIGHLIGINSNVSINVFEEVGAEGYWAAYSFELLEEMIMNYKKSDALDSETASYFEIISNAVSQGKRMAQYDEHAQDAFERFEKAYTFLPSGYQGHALGVVLFKDYLIYVNRGHGSFYDENMSQIYKINHEAVTVEKIKSLANRDRALDSTQLFDAFNDIITDVVTTFPTKEQGYGTCTFVNPKGIIEGMLFLEKFNNLKDQLDESEAIRVAKDYARKEYKNFTSYIREQAIDKLIAFKDRAGATFRDQKIAIQLAIEIIRAHHGQSKETDRDRTTKMQQEVEREYRLLNSFSKSERAEIINEINKDESVDLVKFASSKPELVELLVEAGARSELIEKRVKPLANSTPPPKPPPRPKSISKAPNKPLPPTPKS